MIEFPETASTEWKIVADAANAEAELRARIARETQVERELEKLRVYHAARTTFQQEQDADMTPVLEMGTLDSYRNAPTATLAAPSDLIEGVLKDKGLCIALGASGSGKSTITLQMLHSLMSGDPWLGQPVQQISGSVGVVSYDMDGGLVMDWMNRFPNVDPTKVSVVNAHKRGHPLGVPQLRAQIVAAWRAMQVEVVVIDSFSASFFGQDQNDAGATMHHYRDLGLFALTEVGARALIVITHSTEGSPGRARGSTVHHDVADSIFAVEVEKATQQRSVRMVKYRQHHNGTGKFTTQMTPVTITAPDDVTHLVSLDLGAMTLAGMHLPPGAGAAAFPDLPDTFEEPDLNSESDGEDDDL